MTLQDFKVGISFDDDLRCVVDLQIKFDSTDHMQEFLNNLKNLYEEKTKKQEQESLAALDRMNAILKGLNRDE